MKELQANPASVAAAAPMSAPAETVGLEEIIVTAQKREESLQKTPISIAVLNSKALQERGITNLSDFVNGAVPSLRVVPIIGRPSSLTITMRGINPGDVAQISRDPTVGIYIDGVYFGRSQGLGSEMFDLDRLEVLRGPQGTLFGRNAVGGAISMVSKRPTGELGLDLTAGVRNFDGQNVNAHVNLPEFAGISIKLDGVWSRRDGWVENPLAGQSDWYGYNRRGGRVSALWKPADAIDILYSFDTSRDASVSGYAQFTQLLPGAQPLPPIFSLELDRVRSGRAGLQLEPSVGKVKGHSLHAEWDISDELSLRSISAYREMRQTQYDNSGGLLQPFSPNGVFARLSYTEVEQDQLSQEFQLIGSFDQLSFVLGAFYFKEDGADLAAGPFTAQFNATGTGFTRLPVVLGGPRYPDRASTLHTKSKAIFGQATYTPPLLDERLHLTAGLRWTHDRKRGALTRSRGAVIDIPFEFESKRVDPAVTLAFDWNRDVNSYVRWGRAYRAGGANARSATFRPFGEELVSTWEVGTKAELLGRRARLNIAAYHTHYSNRQVDFLNPANPSNIETLNAPDATTIKGVEIDLSFVLAKRLLLSGSYAFTDWEAARDVNPFNGAVQTGGVTYTPKHSATAAIDYEFEPFSVGKVTAHFDMVYSSSFFTGGAQHPKTGSYAMLNGRVTLGELEMPDGAAKLALSLWGKNLTNTEWEVFQFGIAGPGLSNVLTTHFNEPRTYGLEARLTF
jgi:iron complex outermembrane receptor protein